MKITLSTTISELPRAGNILTKRLHKLGLKKVSDLVFYYPFRYDDFSQITLIAKVQPNTTATVKAKVNLIATKRSPRKRIYITEALVSDQTGSLKIIWFNQPFIPRLIQPGNLVYFSGKVEHDQYGFYLNNPTYEKVKAEQTHTARIVPVYSLTENLTEKQIRYLVKLVLPLAKNIPDWLPENIKREYHLLNLSQALFQIHFPTNWEALTKAQNRLKFDELFLIQLKTQFLRKELAQEKAPAIKFNQALTQKFVESLPYKLTNSQKKSAWEILKDIQEKKPMNRLLEGDVGSGKTVVAAIAILNTIDSGYQAALMAPTEILAQQHYKTITSLFKKFSVFSAPSAVSVPSVVSIKPLTNALLTRTSKKINNRQATEKIILNKISSGKVNVIIGTHALIQDKVEFENLSLVIVDEQHRFGVEQRKNLKQKSDVQPASAEASAGRRATSDVPHFLSMTATPIPRSLALTLYGDLDLSIINEMPVGRKKVLTKIVPLEKRQLAYQFIRDEIKTGRQVFVICPLIDPSDKLGVKAATAEYEKLRKKVFPDLKIGLLHGKLKAIEKEEAMKNFQQKKLDILVATPVVEVGIDIPNASVMMIEGAERFGLAQLHQFRGRVGRASHQSYCFIFTESDSEKTIERLNALITAKDGFALAEKDLEFRGPGEIYGYKQSGFPELKIAKLTDYAIIKNTREAAQKLYPELNKYPLLKQKLAQFSQSIHLE